MARPIKTGLDYFPLDVDMDTDDKIGMIEALHGIEGYGVVVKLLSKIYKEGYFYEWTSREQLLFSKRINVDSNTIADIVNDCIKEGFFNKTMFDKYNILTSKGIQKRYLEAVKRRKQVVFDSKYFLIDDVEGIVGTNKIFVLLEYEGEKRVNVNNNSNDDNKNSINVNKSTQRKGKERKEKESNYIKEPEDELNETAKIIQFWDNNGFGYNNLNAKNRLLDWLDESQFIETGDIILQALEIATGSNKRTLNYVEGVLRRWENNGCSTLADVKAYQEEFETGKQSQSATDWEAMANE